MPDFNLGVPDIDEDHRKLFESFTHLSSPEVYRDTVLRVQAVGDFIDYATSHLGREEQLMRKLKYPGYSEHRSSHRDLQDAFTALVRDVLKGVLEQREAINKLQSIFLEHTLTVDSLFAQWMLTKIPNRSRS